MDTFEMMSEIEEYKKFLDSNEDIESLFRIRSTKDEGVVGYFVPDSVALKFDELDKKIKDLPYSLDEHIEGFSARWSKLKGHLEEKIRKESETDEAMSKIQKGLDKILEKREELVQKYKTFLDKIDGGVSVLTCLAEFEDLDSYLVGPIDMDKYIVDFTARWSQLKEFIRKELVKKEIKKQKREETILSVVGISILVIIALAIIGGVIAFCILDPMGVVYTVLGAVIVFAMMFISIAPFVIFENRNVVPWYIIISAIIGMSATGLLFIPNEVGIICFSYAIVGNLFSFITVACNEKSGWDGAVTRTPGQHKINRVVATITGIVVLVFYLVMLYIFVPQAIHWAIAFVYCAIYVTIWTIIGVKAKGNFLPAYIIVNTFAGLGTIGLFFVPQVGFIYGIGTLSGIAISLVISIIISIVRRNKAKHK